LAIFGCKRVNYDEMDGDRLRLPANRNCYRLSRVSWALLKLLVSSNCGDFWWVNRCQLALRHYTHFSPPHLTSGWSSPTRER